MKKLVSLMLILSMVLCLAACGKKKTVTTYVTNQNGVDVQLTLHAEGDIIKKMVQTNSISLSDVPEEYMSQLDEVIEQAKAQVDGIDGVTYTSEKTDTAIIETVEMDISKKETLKTLIDKGLLPVDRKDADYLSLKATRKGLESNGYTESK